ncbi:phosphatidate cytidylyltransferase [Diaminobutyricimonas aerilata]|uniref:phosphatidate cytidylyltransferase n=1 Tax=Diaminobutyricimonas aerilata TaxID=1162967 RepID=UPI001FE3A3E6|nr:phosphatidate cytidylyltransferase [Diaminobutyricimonas aerilata]
MAEFEAQVRARKAQLDAIEERIEARTGRNLPLAILIGLVLGFALLFSLIVEKAFYMPFAAALVAFTSFELASALRFAGRDVPRLPTVLAGVAVVPAAFYGHAEGHWLASLGGMAFVTLWRVAELARPSHRASARELWADIASGVFIQAYVTFLGTITVLLTAEEGGQWWTLAFLIVVIGSDTAAYASGLLWGRHPLAPRISPKKTWEGFLGSIAVAVVIGIFLAEFMIRVPWWAGIVFGLVLVVTATLGDLVESLIKRDLGIKDISTWLPGHGGFLDRVDSVLPSAAAAYALYLVFGT